MKSGTRTDRGAPGPPSEQLTPLAAGETFRFHCHPDAACFTRCCRQLELALTPYDVLRLKSRLKLPAADFLARYAMLGEDDPTQAFPQVYLAMNEDEEETCPFVGPAGCTVYEDRPAACRAYPLGRGRRLHAGGHQELFVILREEHCQGFAAEQEQDAAAWLADQGLEPYNRLNDALLPLLHHRKAQKGWRPDAAQQERYLFALYDLDTLKTMIASGEIRDPGLTAALASPAGPDDSALLLAAIRWLGHDFFDR